MKITRADVPLILIKVGLAALLVSWILYALAGCTLYSDGHVAGAYDQKAINAELNKAEKLYGPQMFEAVSVKQQRATYQWLMHGACKE
jgi:hypothetical protein